MISEQASEDANIIWGAAFDENMDDEMSVTVIATGFATHDGSEEAENDLDDEPVEPVAAVQAPTSPRTSSSAKAPAAASTSRPRPSTSASDTTQATDDDDTFVDIMSIFNRNK